MTSIGIGLLLVVLALMIVFAVSIYLSYRHTKNTEDDLL